MSDPKHVAPGHGEAGIYHAPWERAFERIITPFEDFIHRETTSGMLLMCTAIIALVLSNSSLADSYLHLLHTPFGITLGDWSIEKSLHHWVNDGLMALFFFVVGLELKREFLVGELADPRAAALPVIAALGGMIVPALIFYVINPSGDAARGWGIPMATDIAFALGAIALLAGRVPKALIMFLVALAIVDDLGAVLVIALFYTENIMVIPLLTAVALLCLLLCFNLFGIRNVLPYFLVAVLMWYALLQSGIHATLAGVLGAFAIPARPKYDPLRFSSCVRSLMERFDRSLSSGRNIMTNDDMRAVVQSLEHGAQQVETPLQRLEHAWHLPVAYFVIPVFALFNAGIPLHPGELLATLSHPVTLGVGLGLFAGKLVGIAGSSWIALRLGVGQLPTDTRFTQIIGVALLGGIGFTMSIFVTELGYAGQPELLRMAKTGVLTASVLAGLCGYFWLYFTGNRNRHE
jgi:Na+:H+ antiporter, NhaA family